MKEFLINFFAVLAVLICLVFPPLGIMILLIILMIRQKEEDN